MALGNNECCELMKLVLTWDSLPAQLRTALMAIVRTSKNMPANYSLPTMQTGLEK